MTRDLSTIAQDLIKTDPALAAEVRRQLIDANLEVLTARQRECLNFIQAYAVENAAAPSIRAIAEHMGQASPSNVHRMVVAIERHGFIKRGASGAISSVEDA